jgi:hypothetical protein
MLAEKRSIIPPIDGWKRDSYYIVDVSFCKANPIHRKIFYVGFVDSNGNPSSYNMFFSQDRLTIKDVFYLKVIKEIDINI